jgi:hypothetical protein
MEIEHIIKKQLEITDSIRDSADLGDGKKEAANLFGFIDGWIFPGESGVVKRRLELGGRRWALYTAKGDGWVLQF